MAAGAQTRQVIARPTFIINLWQIFQPIVQIFLFILGCSLILGTLVVGVGFIISRVNADPRLFNGILAILPNVIINGITLGFLYAIIALGYTMVYGVLEFINFAHGEIFMVGAFVGGELAIFFASRGILGAMPPLLFVLLAIVLGMVVSGLLAMGIERVAYRPLRNAPRLVPLIAAIGVSLVLQDGVRFIEGLFGRFYLTYPELGLTQRFQIARLQTGTGATIPVSIDAKSLLLIVSALVVLVLLNYLVNVTTLGKAIRAVAQDRATASLMGINVNRIIAITFLIGGALGGAAGVLFGVRYVTISPYVGFTPGLKAFTAAVVGGIGNITGAMVGGIVLGFLEAFVAGYLTILTFGRFPGADYANIVSFLILIGILIFRPSGLLGEATTQKV